MPSGRLRFYDSVHSLIEGREGRAHTHTHGESRTRTYVHSSGLELI